MLMEKIILPNGLTCCFHAMPNTHSITVGLYVKAGPGYGEKKPGITHLLEHLHFRQLGSLTQDELYYKMESIGSSLRGVTYRAFLQFSMKAIPRYYSTCLMLFSSLLTANTWSESNFLKERQVVLNQITEKGNYYNLDSIVQKLVFKKHNLSQEITGTNADVLAITLEDVIDYKSNVFCGSNLLACITGNITEDDKLQAIRMFSRIELPNGKKQDNIPLPPRFFKRSPDIDIIRVNDNSPVEVNISFDVRVNELIKCFLDILNCILGEGVGSRLQRQVREVKCLSSDICSDTEWYAEFAVLHIHFSVDKNNIPLCIKAVIDTVKSLKTNITQEDLDTTMPFFTENKVFLEDDTEEMNFSIAYNEILLKNCAEGVPKQSTKQIIDILQTISREIFIPSNCSVAMLGNTKGFSKKTIADLVKQNL